MAKWRMPEIVCQGERFGEVFIQAKGPRDRPSNLGDLEGMRETCAVMITFVLDENLGLAEQPPKGVGMDDPVAVARGRRKIAHGSRVAVEGR